MRILIDECVPRKLKRSLPLHDCMTVQEAGLGGRQNGDLLAMAEGKFDVFLTVDKGLRYQQNLSERTIAILLVRAKSNDIDDVLPHVPQCLDALNKIRPGEVVVIGDGG